MANPIITNVDLGGVVLEGASFRDDTLTLAGADELLEGTILARSIASGKLILFVDGGSTDGNGVPKTVLTYPVSAAGAGDVSVRAMVDGKVRKERLVIDGSAAGVGITNVIIDQLRDYGIVALNVTELNKLDNQP